MLTFSSESRSRFFQKLQILENVFDLEGILWMKMQSLSISEDSVEKIRTIGCTGLYKEYQRSWVYGIRR